MVARRVARFFGWLLGRLPECFGRLLGHFPGLLMVVRAVAWKFWKVARVVAWMFGVVAGDFLVLAWGGSYTGQIHPNWMRHGGVLQSYEILFSDWSKL